MKPVNINRLAWVFDQAGLFAGRLMPPERDEAQRKVEEARRELEKYLGKKLRETGSDG